MATDALDQLAGPAGELLARVDATLSQAGAPGDHPVWPLVRRLGVLPGMAVGAVAALGPAPLAAAGPALHSLAERYDQLGVATAVLPDGAGWQGVAAEAFATRWAALSAHLAGGAGTGGAGGGGGIGGAGGGDGIGGAGAAGGAGADSLAGRLAATARYAQAVADWADRTRSALARTLITVLTSAEAVVLVTAPATDGWPPDVVRAAADIAARVLGPVASAYDEADDLLMAWSGRLGELPFPAPAESTPTEPTTLVVPE